MRICSLTPVTRGEGLPSVALAACPHCHTLGHRALGQCGAAVGSPRTGPQLRGKERACWALVGPSASARSHMKGPANTHTGRLPTECPMELRVAHDRPGTGRQPQETQHRHLRGSLETAPYPHLSPWTPLGSCTSPPGPGTSVFSMQHPQGARVTRTHEESCRLSGRQGWPSQLGSCLCPKLCPV